MVHTLTGESVNVVYKLFKSPDPGGSHTTAQNRAKHNSTVWKTHNFIRMNIQGGCVVSKKRDLSSSEVSICVSVCESACVHM